MKIAVYYKPEDTANPDGISIDSNWPKEVQALQRKMLVERGYLPLIEDGQNIQSALEVSTCTIEKSKDRLNRPIYIRKWKTRKILVHLSMDKMCSLLQAHGILSKVLSAVQSDSTLADWWFNKRTFVKGEQSYINLCRRLGIPEDIMEQMAEKCREIR